MTKNFRVLQLLITLSLFLWTAAEPQQIFAADGQALANPSPVTQASHARFSVHTKNGDGIPYRHLPLLPANVP